MFVLHRDAAFDAQNPFSKAQGSGKARLQPAALRRVGRWADRERSSLFYFAIVQGDARQRTTTVITSPLVPVGNARRRIPTDGTRASSNSTSVATARSMTARYRVDKIGGERRRHRRSEFARSRHRQNAAKPGPRLHETAVISPRRAQRVPLPVRASNRT